MPNLTLWRHNCTMPVFHDLVDAGGGGGQPGGEPAPAPAAEPAPEPAIVDPDADPFDDDEADEPAAATRTPDQQLEAMRARQRKMRRQYRAVKQVADRFKGVDVDSLRMTARQYEQLQAELARNPKLRALVSGEDEPVKGNGTNEPDPDDADLVAEQIGFDPNETQANKTLAQALKTIRAMRRELDGLKELKPTVESMRQRDERARADAETAEWSGVLTEALTQLGKDMPRTTPAEKAMYEFVAMTMGDALRGAYQSRATNAIGPKAVLKHYLDKFVAARQLTTTQAAAVAGAAQVRIAAHNRSLPAPIVGGTPAGPAGNRKERLADVHKRLRKLG